MASCLTILGNQMQNARGFPNSAAAAAAAANMRRMNLPPQMHKTGKYTLKAANR